MLRKYFINSIVFLAIFQHLLVDQFFCQESITLPLEPSEESAENTNFTESDEVILEKSPMQFQSPIDIDPKELKINTSLKLNLISYDKVYSPVVTLFNGQVVKLTTKFIKKKPKVKFINQTFLMDNVHFHWGVNETIGSEHSINGSFYAMEAHFMHHNAKYRGMQQALRHQDGVLSIAVLFNVSNEDNPRLTDVINMISRISGSSQITHLQPDQLKPSDVLPKNTKEFYYYFGSLTTTPFTEVVQWVIFRQTCKISQRQLDQIRRSAQYSTKGVQDGWRGFSNTREVQPLNGRNVMISFNNTANATNEN